jgi:hypothetical protein
MEGDDDDIVVGAVRLVDMDFPLPSERERYVPVVEEAEEAEL